jgi:hypothetical protein
MARRCTRRRRARRHSRRHSRQRGGVDALEKLIRDVADKTKSKTDAVSKRAEQVRELDAAIKLAGDTPELKTQMRAARKALAAAVRALTQSAEAAATGAAADDVAALPDAALDAALKHVQRELKSDVKEFGALYSEGAATPDDMRVLADVAAGAAGAAGASTQRGGRSAYFDERARIQARRDNENREEDKRLFKQAFTDHGIDPYTCDVEHVLATSRDKLANVTDELKTVDERIKTLKSKGAGAITNAELHAVAGLKALQTDAATEISRLTYIIDNLKQIRTSHEWRYVRLASVAALVGAIVVASAYAPNPK